MYSSTRSKAASAVYGNEGHHTCKGGVFELNVTLWAKPRLEAVAPAVAPAGTSQSMTKGAAGAAAIALYKLRAARVE